MGLSSVLVTLVPALISRQKDTALFCGAELRHHIIHDLLMGQLAPAEVHHSG